jgi:hypothetical protein
LCFGEEIDHRDFGRGDDAAMFQNSDQYGGEIMKIETTINRAGYGAAS